MADHFSFYQQRLCFAYHYPCYLVEQQAQLYFAGKSRYIGVFDTREKAALAYEIAREKLKSEKSAADGALTPKQTENAVNAARKAAFDGVNEKDPRLAGK